MTLPQLLILSHDGKMPNPRRRSFASASEAISHLKETGHIKDEPPPTPPPDV